MSGEKTEEPTKKKLADARKKGQSSKSQDVNAAVGLVGLLACLIATGPAILDRLARLLSRAIERGTQTRDNTHLLPLASELVADGFSAILPLVLLSVALAVAASCAQVGFLLSFEPLSPNFDKVNPASGLKRLFSVRSLIDLAKMALKAVALGWVMWVMVMDMLPLLIASAHLAAPAVGVVAWKAIVKLAAAACAVFIVIGPVDFGMQKWLFKRDQKMSKDDVKRETKEAEGDPLLKDHRKQLAREMVDSNPQQHVPGASVVVTNPTHYAVALRYRPGESTLPLVVAKGMDAEAARIRAIAQQHRVPVVGNPPLARALHKLELNAPIPEELFEAVAAVLRWVAHLDALAPPSNGSPPG